MFNFLVLHFGGKLFLLPIEVTLTEVSWLDDSNAAILSVQNFVRLVNPPNHAYYSGDNLFLR